MRHLIRKKNAKQTHICLCQRERERQLEGKGGPQPERVMLVSLNLQRIMFRRASSDDNIYRTQKGTGCAKANTLCVHTTDLVTSAKSTKYLVACLPGCLCKGIGGKGQMCWVTLELLKKTLAQICGRRREGGRERDESTWLMTSQSVLHTDSNRDNC